MLQAGSAALHANSMSSALGLKSLKGNVQDGAYENNLISNTETECGLSIAF